MRVYAIAFPSYLSSFPTAGLTCLLHLQFHVLQKYAYRLNYAIAVARPAGLTLTCLGSKRHPLVIMAHRIRAFLFAIATAAFCQPDFSRSSYSHFEMGSLRMLSLIHISEPTRQAEI